VYIAALVETEKEAKKLLAIPKRHLIERRVDFMGYRACADAGQLSNSISGDCL
jgi:hypothetical protein